MDTNLADKLPKGASIFKSEPEMGALTPARALWFAAAD